MASNGRRRAPTATSNFGVSRRENHDASAFYDRFTPPATSDDETVLAPAPVADPIRVADARHMADLPDGSVALVVTSPPYFAGKQYEEELSREGIPASYVEYLDLLREVFRECARVLEPGGRIAVNVANLGRKPYRSLSADVITILQDDLGLLLRGEVLWQKAAGAGGNCAWGSFRQATNPTLRDLTERVVVASKGRFDRALTVEQRRAAGLPHRSTVTADEYMAATLDVWQIAPESARRVAHPAPFPVELPERLILLYTYEDDLVLDPFLGSGSALVAAARHGRRYVGYDLDPAYAAIAERRVDDELAAVAARTAPAEAASVPAPAMPAAATAMGAAPRGRGGGLAGRARPGRPAPAAHDRRRAGAGRARARRRLPAAGRRRGEGDAQAGARAAGRGRLRAGGREAQARPDRGRRAAGHGRRRRAPVAVRRERGLHHHPGRPAPPRRPVAGRRQGPRHRRHPAPRSATCATRRSCCSPPTCRCRAARATPPCGPTGPAVVFDAVELLDPVAVERLALYAKGGHHDRPAPGFWPAPADPATPAEPAG